MRSGNTSRHDIFRHSAIYRRVRAFLSVTSDQTLSKADFQALSEFRFQLRRFLHFSEQVAVGEGLTPLQYLLLLHIKGFPGKETPTVGELAQRLLSQQHGVVALVSRCERAGLVRRVTGASDRRMVHVSLTPRGEQCLNRLATLHRSELRSLVGVFKVANLSAFNERDET
jgi:DNA-binding MarR family transcriptional regulator